MLEVYIIKRNIYLNALQDYGIGKSLKRI